MRCRSASLLTPGASLGITELTVGTWLLHCHVGDHMMAGMYATYTILGGGPSAAAAPSRDTGPGWSPF
ncbi:MAG: hypothetical protein DMD45_04105 [Gemmatimonadetes bacterium]|nr:MAG: hypothetical protein DMD45_04105 [Gemmatimonadota bacterium]